MSPRLTATLVVFLLTVNAGLLAWGAHVHSPTIDEVGHLPAGLSHWEFGRFDLYRVNPPLVRMVATIPLLYDGPKVDWGPYSAGPGTRSEFEIGRQLISQNGERSFWYFTLARWACIPFSLLGGYVCWRWARELYGQLAGLLALILWCFCPNILGHAQLITPDVGATALGLTACYFFWRWLKAPHLSWAFAAGIVLGLAELTKTTWILLIPLWPVLWLACRFPPARESACKNLHLELGQLALMLLLGLFVLNLGYGFEGSFERLDNYRFISDALGGPPYSEENVQIPRNRFGGTWLGRVLVPLPRNYLLGIDAQKRDFEIKLWSYLAGEWRKGGWWYYYLYALAVKVPLGAWALGLLALLLTLTRSGYLAEWRDEVILAAPALVVFTFVSAQTGFNHHLRYVLLVLPFLYISAARLLFRPGERGCISATSSPAPSKTRGAYATSLAAGIALAWSVTSSLLIYPHSLSYFNELAGGPKQGHAHLVYSNIDWGQDLFYLKRWLDDHPEARPLGLAYFGGFDPRAAGIDFTLPPSGPSLESVNETTPIGPQPGWYAISASLLRGQPRMVPDGHGGWRPLPQYCYSYFLEARPVARAGYSIYLYHIEGK